MNLDDQHNYRTYQDDPRNESMTRLVLDANLNALQLLRMKLTLWFMVKDESNWLHNRMKLRSESCNSQFFYLFSILAHFNCRADKKF